MGLLTVLLYIYVYVCKFETEGREAKLPKTDQYSICLKEGEISQGGQSSERAGNVARVHPLLWGENEE